MTNGSDGPSRSLPILPALDILSSLALALVAAANFWLLASAGPMIWVDQLEDDAYYYLGIARSIAEHGLFQFLPPFETNGFQPLWQATLAATAYLAGTSTKAMVIECYALSVVFCALFILLSRRLNGSALAAVVVTVFFSGIMLSGMETVMLPAFVLLFFAARGWKMRGVLGSLIFLSRLDAISLVVASDIYALVRRRNVDFRHYSVIVPVAIAYVAFNFFRFGLVLPVSGLSKALQMTPLENIIFAKQYLFWTLPALGILAIVLISKVVSGSRPVGLKYGNELIIFAMAAVVCALYYGTLSGWPLWEWYAWAPMLITYYALLELNEMMRADIASRRFIVLAVSTGAVVAVLLSAGGAGYISNTFRLVRQVYFKAPLTDTFGRKNLELVNWVEAKGLPHGTMFAMGDRAGSFGYFLGPDYRFLHAEGLVADASYYAAMKKDEALSFVERQPIDYWIADREQFLQSDDVVGVPEPIQGMSMHKGVYMICFDKSAIVDDQSYPSVLASAPDQFERRYVFDMKGHVDCPGSLQAKFETLRAGYGQVRAFSLPIEEASHGRFIRYVRHYLGF